MNVFRLGSSEAAAAYGVRTEVIVADLSETTVAETVRQEILQRGLTVDLLVNNAGFTGNTARAGMDSGDRTRQPSLTA